MKNSLDLSQFTPIGLGLDSVSPGAIEPIAPQKKRAAASQPQKPSGDIAEFVRSAGPAAARVAQQLQVPVEAVLGQWGLETGWGKSVIPGTNNLGNIKDFSGRGVAATDNMTGSRDKYRQYGSVDEFADDFSRLLKNKRYSGAIGANDPETYFSILKQGGYAEDPGYVEKGKRAALMAGEAIKKIGSIPQSDQKQLQRVTGKGLSDIPAWTDIERTTQYKGLSKSEKAAAKEIYFDKLISPHIDQASAQEMRAKFLGSSPAEKSNSGLGSTILDTVKDVIKDHNPFYQSAMDGYVADQGKPAAAQGVGNQARKQIEQAWDAASKDVRSKLEQRQDWVGDIARARAGTYSKIDRSIDAVPGLVARGSGGLSDADTRVEVRQGRLIASGENPLAAKRLASDAAMAGTMPGLEAAESVGPSSFDFETARFFDPRQAGNGANNALVRGLAKGGLGAVQAAAGLGQAGYEAIGNVVAAGLGRDGYEDTAFGHAAKNAAGIARWARGKEGEIGERGEFLSRNFEGAVNSLSQQLPLLIAGVATGSSAIPLAGMALQSFGREFSDGRAKGQDGAQASTRAAIFAAFEVIGERFGLKQNMDAIRAAADGMPTDQVLSFLASALKREIPGELLTTTGQFATDKYAPMGVGLHPEYTARDYLSQVADTIAQTVMQSGMMTAGTTGVAGAVRYMKDESGSPAPAIDAAAEQDSGATEQGANDAPPQSPADIADLTPATPENHPSQDVADQIVREMAESTGVPLDIVLPVPATQAEIAQDVPLPPIVEKETADGGALDADIARYAASRLRELTNKRDGVTNTVVSDAGIVDLNEEGGLSKSEEVELNALTEANGDIQKIKAIYGVSSKPADDQQQNSPQSIPPIPPAPTMADPAAATAPEVQPAVQSPGSRTKQPLLDLDLSQRTDEELAFTARNARSPQVLKAVAQERERRRVAQKEDGKAPEPVAPEPVAPEPVAPEPVAQKDEGKKPKTEKERNQMREYDDKWFASKEKADAFIRKKRIDETHESVWNNGKFLIKRRSQPAGVAQEMGDGSAQTAGTHLVNVGAAGADDGQRWAESGRTKPQEGDEVFAENPAMFGGVDYVRGVVKNGKVHILGVDTAFGDVPSDRKTSPLTARWTKKGEKSPYQKQVESQNADQETDRKNLKESLSRVASTDVSDLSVGKLVSISGSSDVVAVASVSDTFVETDDGKTYPIKEGKVLGLSPATNHPPGDAGGAASAERNSKVKSGKKASDGVSRDEIAGAFAVPHLFDDGVYYVTPWMEEKFRGFIDHPEDAVERDEYTESHAGERIKVDGAREHNRVVAAFNAWQSMTGAGDKKTDASINKKPRTEKEARERRQKAKLENAKENAETESKAALLAELKRELGILADRAFEIGHGRLSGSLSAFTFDIKETDSYLTRAWVDDVIAENRKLVERLEKKKNGKKSTTQSKPQQPDNNDSAKDGATASPTNDAASKATNNEAEDEKALPQRDLIKDGDTIVLSRNIEYAKPNTPYLVEKTNKQGVWVLDGETGGRTSFGWHTLRSDDLLSVESVVQSGTWNSSATGSRKAMLNSAGYTDGDQVRNFAATEWSELPSSVREKIESKGQEAGPTKDRQQPKAEAKPVAASETDIDSIVTNEEVKQRESDGDAAKPRSGEDQIQGESDSQQRPNLQPSTARPDQKGVEDESPENGERTDVVADNGRPGAGAADGDVGVGGVVHKSGDAANGRTRTSRKRMADAGAGKESRLDRSSLKNYHIADPEQLIGGTPKVRFSRNKAAIEAYQSISSEGRLPTQEELDVMAAYIGWGSFGQELFQGSYERPRPKDGWQAESDWLREHLGKDAWESAQASIINAHYTDPITVSAMWDMVRQLGFDGGRVLEPSMGVGNFFGLMPRDLMEKSRLTGIEMEQTTGGMAKILYPDANIQIKPYQDSKTADGFYDLVIGNWPFAKDGPADRRYMNLNPSLHDYFFLKALDQTRAGGIVIGITSAGTMDKKTSLVRSKLAKKADLVAAFRLPSGAFEKYAGTAVVTDIIILKKREHENPSPSESGWLRVANVETSTGTVTINEYFAKNPDNILGELGLGSGSAYGRPSMIVKRQADLESRMKALPATLPAGLYEKQSTKKATERFITNNVKDRDLSIITSDNGQLMQIQGEYLVPLEDVTQYKLKDKRKTEQRESQIKELVEIRRLYGRLVDAERDGLPDVESQRRELKQAYEKFTATHGSILDSAGLSIIRKTGDPFYPVLASLEHSDGRPAAIMEKPTVRSKRKMDNPTVADALVIARNESLDISMSRVSELSGVPEEEVAKELIEAGAVFKTPAGNYEISDVYLSGNVRRKLREAEEALELGDEGMSRNIAALKKVVPKDIPYFNIEAKIGATWVGEGEYAKFFAYLLGVEDTSSIEVRWAVNRWRVKLSRALNDRPEATTTWGHSAVKFEKILGAAMSNTTITVRYKDRDGNLVVDDQATAEVAEKIGKIRDEFSGWLWSDAVRKIEMERQYNETMNAIALPKFDGSFLSFEGMALQRGESPFNLRKHQIDAIWRGLANGRSLNAHEVGTGKTYTMGGLAVESRRYGIAKKPIIFAHNANSASVAREIGEMYPGAKLLYVDNLAPEKVSTVLRQIANDDWDAVVVPHSLISKFALKKETLLEISKDQIDAIEVEAIEAAKEDGIELDSRDMDDPERMKKIRSVTAKQLVHARNAIIKKIDDMALRSSKEGAVSFEDMGIDMIIVDEGHEFKKPPIATRMQMKGLNTASSNQSISLMFLTDYVKKINNGKGVHIFTGTPITNTLTEIYNMMRYIMDDQMERDGVRDWDAWFGTFADATSDVELTATGEYEPVTRLASFVNVAELRRMIGQYMDIVFADDMPEFKPRSTSNGKTLSSENLTDAERDHLLNGRTENPVGRPYKKVVTDVAEMTSDQKEILSKLQGYAATFKRASKKDRREMMLAGRPEVPVMVETAAANAGLDARLYDITASDSPTSKVNRAVGRIAFHYNEHPMATQVVFVERGYSSTSESRKKDRETGEVSVTTKERFNLVADLVAKLEGQGIPRKQIAIVDGNTSKEKRKEIADAMNRAEVRVVIGNTKTLGVGVNMQTNLRAMHHLDAPWMPGDLEQRNGRGHRQGNKWNTVIEYRYLTERIDGRRWQVLSVKDRFIKSFLKAKDDVRVIDGDAVSADEADDISSTLSDAAGDPRLLMLNKLRADILKLENKERMHSQAIFDATMKIKEISRKIERNEASIKDMEAVDAAFRAKVKGGLSVVVKGKKYSEANSANEALRIAVDSVGATQVDPIRIGSIWGFDVEMVWRSRADQPRYRVLVEGLAVEVGKPTVESVRQNLYGIQASIRNLKETNDSYRKSIPGLVEATRAPFAREADLKKKRELFDSIQADIQSNPIPAPAWLRNGAPVGSEVFVDGRPVAVEGHRWTDDGYFVTVSGESDGPAIDVDYMDVKDGSGLHVYDPHPFESPVIEPQRNNAEPSDTPAAMRPASGVIEPTQRMSPAEIEKVIAKKLSTFRSKPDISIAESVADVAPWLAPGSAAGAVIDGKIYLFRDALSSEKDVAETLLHELLHYGVRNILSKQDFIAQMDRLYKTSSAIRESADQWLETAAGARVRELQGAAYARAMAAEEAIADIAGSGVASSIPLSVFDSIAGWVAKIAEKLGFRDAAAKYKGMAGIEARDFVRNVFARLKKEQAKDLAVADRVIEPAFLMGSVRDSLIEYFGRKPEKLKTFGLYHKTLSTQYHKALIDRDYGRVFSLVGDMQSHVSLASIRPAELAHDILPRVDSVKAAAKTLVAGRPKDDPIVKASQAVFAGTLHGDTVLDGKVWKDDELRDQFGMKEKEIGIYRQARAAIDASLDELAAAEAYALAQSFVPPELRRSIVDDPSIARSSITNEIAPQIRVLDSLIALKESALDQDGLLEYQRQKNALVSLMQKVEKVFDTADKLKAAGYAPLMRFGKYTVTVELVDQGADGKPIVEYFGKFDTEAEALAVKKQMEAAYSGDEYRVSSGVASQSAHELYAGVSPETIAIFGEAVGAGEIAEKYYQLVLSERNALKRRMQRKGTAGYSQELPRVLSNFITSNARFAAQRLYLRDVNSTIRSIPREKGDVLDEAIELKKFILDPNDAAAPVSSVMFAWFLGGSVAAAMVNLSQPLTMTAPYLSQFGAKLAATAITKAVPFALGKKQVNGELRSALKRASQEGVVDAQEIFHLYSVGSQGVSSRIASTLSRLPVIGSSVAKGSESAKARIGAFMTLWGSMFSLAESFNRRLTFVAAWDVAIKTGSKNPYEFAVRAVNETQGIYNKSNRSNWARNPTGRVLLTFKQYSIGYLELISRMWKSGPNGKKAVFYMLGVLLLLSGISGLPFAQDLDDLIDTIGQLVGFDTNAQRSKMELANELLGKEVGGALLYGVSSFSPIDLSGRLGLGNLIPGSSLLKPAGEQGRSRDVMEVAGPAGGLVAQVADAYDAATNGAYAKALQNLSPKAIRDATSAAGMISSGYATDSQGRRVVDVGAKEALAKAIGFNPTVVANQHRKTMPLQQDAALQRKMESSIAHQWAAGIVAGDRAMVEDAIARRDGWNKKNPRTRVSITQDQIRSRVKQMRADKVSRVAKSMPKEVAAGLDSLR